MLNPQSPIPLYHQLADILLVRVRSGEYPPGSRIPSEHALAASCAVGRPTVRQAVEVLVRKGILERRRGSGTYVARDPREVDIFSLAGTLSAFQRGGVPASSKLLRKPRLVKVPSDGENPFSGERAYFLSRLSIVEGTPVLLEDFYLHPDHFAGIEEVDFEDRSLSHVVDELYFMRPTGGRQTFRIATVKGKRARALAVSSETAILLVKRYLHFPRIENGVYSELFCRTDRFVFSQTIGGVTHD
ncbi:MAG: GntR family transcriptional regulator [Deltaproteobacteria bacterium]|nr:GntR family transcriptional regulator [Deltaproteobacteria bacterium]